MRRDIKPLVTHLDANGRFYRDRAVGRIFHPGSHSYREVSATDSVHLVVEADNRVSVHVDRLSPLLVRAGRVCRYSFWRAAAHNLVVAVETLARMVRGQNGHQTCHLDCDIVWVPDDTLADDEPAVA